MHGVVLQVDEPLHKQSTGGAFFQTTLASHGYVFAGKGTVEALLSDLFHEDQVYELLRRVQHSPTPVCLGSIDLKRTYYLDVGAKTIYIPFTS
jgi:hypothetical protein